MNVDVTIVGAGPTGLCLAYTLANAGMNVAVLERQPRSALADPTFDGREIALTHESQRLLQEWGLWEHFPADEVSDLRHAKVLDGHALKGMNIGPDLGKQSQLGWLVPNHLIRLAAFKQCATQERVHLLDGIQIRHTRTHTHGAEVGLDDGCTITSRLLVAADSRFSETRRAQGIPTQMHDYGKSMMVFRVNHEVPHDHVAWEWFGYGQTRALLPLNGQQASVVLTLPHHAMQALQRLDDDAFDQDISQRYEYQLGAMKRISERNVYPLVGTYAFRFHNPRFALIGDAAVGMHPVTAHGFNLGALSVKHLSERVIDAYQQGKDIASEDVLRSYTQAHRRSSLPLYAATNMVIALYTNDLAPARFLRKTVLKAADALQPFKRLVASQLTG
ncbi:MAG: 5-demethoxyubiquinol-8 5-hydroxylase UbiM [Paenalcaligenes sp.]